VPVGWLSAEEWAALRLSLLVAGVATLASLPLGIAVAYLLARGRFWGKSALDTLVHLPLILPPVVTGYLLLLAFGRRGPIGAFLADTFGIVLSFRWTGAALACAVMGFRSWFGPSGCPSKGWTASWKPRPGRSGPRRPMCSSS
jgi:molybdate transport system permease protein